MAIHQWVVRPEGCIQANPNLTHCEDSRGLLFGPNKSSTWSIERLDNDGLFELNTYYEGFLNLTGNAYCGFDTITVGLPGSDLPSFNDQIIAGFGQQLLARISWSQSDPVQLFQPERRDEHARSAA